MGYHTEYYGQIFIEFSNDDVRSQFQQLLTELNRNQIYDRGDVFTYDDCLRIKSGHSANDVHFKLPVISIFLSENIDNIECYYGRIIWTGEDDADTGIIWMGCGGIYTKILNIYNLTPD